MSEGRNRTYMRIIAVSGPSLISDCMKQILPGNNNHHNFVVNFTGIIALRLKKLAQLFSSFNPFPSLPPIATDDRKQFQSQTKVLNNKTGPLYLEFNSCEKGFSFLQKIANSMW